MALENNLPAGVTNWNFDELAGFSEIETCARCLRELPADEMEGDYCSECYEEMHETINAEETAAAEEEEAAEQAAILAESEGQAK